MPNILKICLVVAAYFLFSTQLAFAASIPAFPGAQGFGAIATGGRGGSVYFVTNLNKSGSGSLTECVKLSNTTCIFKVGGVINYGEDELVISGSNLTIAGQTAPGGITIQGALIADNKSALVNLQGRNIIMRHIRIRGGGDTLRVEGAKDVMLDHISLSWATDENFGGTQGAENVTMQWSLIGEGIIGHSKAIILTTAATNFSFHHNIFAHNEERHPRLQTGKVEFINNIIFNHQAGSIIETRADHAFVPIELNYIGNWMIDGPELSPGASWYQKNLNIKEVNVYLEDNNHGSIGNPSRATKNNFSMPYPINISAGQTIKQPLLTGAGAYHFSRDSVDTRIIDETTRGVKNPGYATSYPQISEVVWPSDPPRQSTVPDADADGMDDNWERLKGLNPATEDGQIVLGSGYTNLELYLNELAQGDTTQPDPDRNPADIAPLTAPDGRVDIFDYSLLLENFGTRGAAGFHPADIIQDGVVDIFDYNAVLAAFGQ